MKDPRPPMLRRGEEIERLKAENERLTASLDESTTEIKRLSNIIAANTTHWDRMRAKTS